MTFFEMAMDEMAYAANVDPLEFRLNNYSDIDAMNGTPYTSKALREAYHAGAVAFGLGKRIMAPRPMRDGSELVGWGMGDRHVGRDVLQNFRAREAERERPL